MKLPPLPFSAGRTLVVLLLTGCTLGLHAGDCSGPDDCAAIPDNATKAAVGGAIIAGYCLVIRSRRRMREPVEGADEAVGLDPLVNPKPLHRGPPDGPLGDPGDLKPPLNDSGVKK